MKEGRAELRPSFQEIKGLLRLEAGAIVLEYRISYWGCYTKAKVHEVRIPLELVSEHP